MSVSPESRGDGESVNDENVQDEHVLRGGHPSYGVNPDDTDEQTENRGQTGGSEETGHEG